MRLRDITSNSRPPRLVRREKLKSPLFPFPFCFRSVRTNITQVRGTECAGLNKIINIAVKRKKLTSLRSGFLPLLRNKVPRKLRAPH